MSKRFDGRVAFVTGAASGIGLACAQRYLEEGAAVVGYDLNTSDQWPALANAHFIQGDVTDEAALQAAVAETINKFGRVDILVTAAGIADAGPVHMVEAAAWDRVLDINLKGTFLAAKAVLPSMIEQRSGSIITIASVEGLVGSEGGSSYNASKGGVVLLTKNMAMDYAKLGIRVNAICPGFIDTPLLRATLDHDFMADYKAEVLRETKLGRFGKPEDIAGAAFFLASDDAAFVTGQALAVDGGYTAGHGHGLVELMGLV